MTGRGGQLLHRGGGNRESFLFLAFLLLQVDDSQIEELYIA